MQKSENVMTENKEDQLSSISRASSTEEIGAFWDAHSLDDYWDQTHEVEFDVRAERRRRITLDPEVYERLEAIARARGVLPETLVNLWVAERLQQAG
jgi:CopG antitoxin of type II toxin-antitoxin system